VLRLRIAMARGPGEHRRRYPEFEEVLILTLRRHSGPGALVSELLG
jgi:hypothetical protein